MKRCLFALCGLLLLGAAEARAQFVFVAAPQPVAVANPPVFVGSSFVGVSPFVFSSGFGVHNAAFVPTNAILTGRGFGKRVIVNAAATRVIVNRGLFRTRAVVR